jgi:hypothetical protein
MEAKQKNACVDMNGVGPIEDLKPFKISAVETY